MKVKEFFNGKYTNETGFFILDSSAGEDGKTEYEDKDYIHYSYNTKRYNKLKPGDLFIYRRPKKASKNRKFYFYGGGLIKKIEKVNDEDRVIATIELGFKLGRILYEDDPKVKNMIWTFKTKGSTWEHFWGQYGMNKITKEDFFGLIGDCECIEDHKCSTSNTSVKDLLSDEKAPVNKDAFNKDFTIDIDDGTSVTKTKGNIKSKMVVRCTKIDYNKQNETNKTIGDLGEIKVLEMEKEFLRDNGKEELAKKVEYTAQEYGDGYGYDIVSYDLNGSKKFIEVKTTTSNKIDGFYITPSEINASNEKGKSYYVYRLYDLDVENGAAKLKIYNGPVGEEKFKLTAVSYKVTLK